MAPRGWRQRRKALWSGEAIVTNFEGAEKSDRLEKSSISEIPRSLELRWRTIMPLSAQKQRERRAAQRAAEAQDAARGQRNRPAPSRC